MALYRRRTGGSWHYRFVLDGREYRGSTRTRNRRVAEDVERAVRDDIVRGRFGLSTARRVTFQQAASLWLKSKAGRADRTLADYEQLVAGANAHLGHKLVTAISADDISSLQALRERSGVGPRRVNYEVSIVRQVLKRYGEWSRLAHLISWRKEPQDKGRAIDLKEEARLLEAAASSGSPALLVLIVISLDTGLRRMELRQLRHRNLDLRWDGGVITAGGLTVPKSKTEAGTMRYVPFTERARGALSLWLSRPELIGATADDYVFPRHSVVCSGTQPRIEDVRLDQPIGDWKTSWNRARRLAGVKLRWHDLRHSFITRLAENPAISETTIRSLAGHVSAKMLARYAHIRNRAKHDAIEALERTRREGSAHDPAQAVADGGDALARSARIH